MLAHNFEHNYMRYIVDRRIYYLEWQRSYIHLLSRLATTTDLHHAYSLDVVVNQTY